MIHPTAIVHPKAQLAAGVEVGPWSVVDEGVVLGAGCILGPFVHLTGRTTIGARNRFHAGCVIGDAPQDLRYAGAPTGLRIGDDNLFREHVTVHRSNVMGEETVIGSGNFLMVNSHVGHNCRIGNNTIVANGALIAGHVVIEDRAFISGNCLVHQFVRIGTLALMQGGSAISKDLPPFTVARGENGICGLNTVGLRRAQISSPDRLELKRLYHLLFRSGKRLQESLALAGERFQARPSRQVLEFMASSQRGFCGDDARTA